MILKKMLMNTRNGLPEQLPLHPRGGGGGGPHNSAYEKGVVMLVVSLRGVNFGFWSHLGCSGQNPISYLAVPVSFRVARQKYKKYQEPITNRPLKVYIVRVLTWSLLGVKKSLGHAQIGLL